MKKSQKILILGGAGFIGSNLTEFFVDAGEKVIVFDRKKANWKNLEPIVDKIKIIKGDFDKSEDIEKVFEDNDIEIVIHLISSVIPSTSFDEIIQDKELINTIKLINTMKKNKVNKIVFFSSGGVIYGYNGEKVNSELSPTIPISFYGWLKLSIENYIKMYSNTYGLKYIILRPSNPYGMKQNLFGKQGLITITLGKLLQKKQVEVWGDGEIIRDYIYIDDLCRAVVLLINKSKWGNIYNIGTGNGFSINNIMSIIKKVTGINFNINYKNGRKVDIPVNILDISKLKNDISWNPLINIEEGIKKYWETLKHKI